MVLHYTAMTDCAAARRALCDPATEVSAHWLISEQGQALPLVDEAMRAWHAGAGRWGDVTDINSRSIGIELSNPGDAPFAAAQMNALEELLARIMQRHGIGPERVIAHSDCAIGRKIDPGPRFDWRRLAKAGLSVWPEVADVEWDDATGAERTDQALMAFGYTGGATPGARLAAFRLRFRPRQGGPCSAADLSLATDLARRFPVDRAGISA